MSDDLDEGLSWILVGPRATSRGPSSPPECLTLSVRLLPDVGATNEIKTLAFPPSLEKMAEFPVFEKIYVEGSNLIFFVNVFKSLSLKSLSKGMNRGSRWMAGRSTGIISQSQVRDIEVTHGKSHRKRLTSKPDPIRPNVM